MITKGWKWEKSPLLSTVATFVILRAREYFTPGITNNVINAFSLSQFPILIFMLLQIGVWKSWEKDGLDIKDIVWPGNSHTPPQGVPEKFHLKITFLEEQPYISLTPPDPVTGKCSMNRGVLCRVGTDPELATAGWVLLYWNFAHTFRFPRSQKTRFRLNNADIVVCKLIYLYQEIPLDKGFCSPFTLFSNVLGEDYQRGALVGS
jgi:hypothetical protein